MVALPTQRGRKTLNRRCNAYLTSRDHCLPSENGFPPRGFSPSLFHSRTTYPCQGIIQKKNYRNTAWNTIEYGPVNYRIWTCIDICHHHKMMTRESDSQVRVRVTRKESQIFLWLWCHEGIKYTSVLCQYNVYIQECDLIRQYIRLSWMLYIC